MSRKTVRQETDVHWIAEQALTVVQPDGGRVDVVARVGLPYPVDGHWKCPVSLQGLERRLPDIAGGSSLQALSLALGLIAQLLGYTVEDGGRLEMPDEPNDGESPVPDDELLNALFPAYKPR